MAFLDLVEGVGVVVAVLFLASFLDHYALNSRTYEVTGMSPQSSTVAQELNGFASSGTL